MYALREALRGMVHTRSMTLVSIVTITVALIILSVFGILTLYAHSFVNSLMKSEEINVFLKFLKYRILHKATFQVLQQFH